MFNYNAEMFTTSRNVAHVDQHFRLLELWALHRDVVAAFPVHILPLSMTLPLCDLVVKVWKKTLNKILNEQDG
jgi:hypothetical protein